MLFFLHACSSDVKYPKDTFIIEPFFPPLQFLPASSFLIPRKFTGRASLNPEKERLSSAPVVLSSLLSLFSLSLLLYSTLLDPWTMDVITALNAVHAADIINPPQLSLFGS